ncbi:unnamed protein product [Vitrella brassicaformis CCMP3155]|uniref:Uncharacterized protein n=2 Tax=Vitrella brassicaformis TaxID=1169539 RepID=A0A0G4FKZ4_VITBC|nr:unnamed protein product [Vitrella brassicaformis CCMP3155]|eukprot:CEM14446.1 unnamed protein product [Vitrella brassicaformis CCMP3155]
MRHLIVELIEPTIHRVTQTELSLKSLREMNERIQKDMHDAQLLSVKADQQVSMVEHFREELSKWDVQRRNHESKLTEELSVMKHDLDGFRYNLERKDTTIQGLQRAVERATQEVNRLMDGQDQLRQYSDERIDLQSKQLSDFRTETEVKLVAVETKHNALADELWGEETGLAKVTGELNKSNQIVSALNEEVKRIARSKASTADFEKLQSEVKDSIEESASAVATLKTSVNSAVQEVKEHFRTASNTIAAHNATMMQEVRAAYTDELTHAAKLRNDVQNFMHDTQGAMQSLEKTVDGIRSQTEAMVKEVRLDVEELNKKRKRDKANSEIELRQLKKRIGGVYDNSDAVLKGIEHIAGVMAIVLESNKVACAVSLQDDDDRRKVALMGYKEAGQGGPSAQQPGAAPIARKGTQAAPTVISVDNRCLSCSGQSATVLAGFKMACLQYHPGPVPYSGKHYSRGELLAIRSQLIEQASEALHLGPEGRGGGPSGGMIFGSVAAEGRTAPGSASSVQRELLHASRLAQYSPGSMGFNLGGGSGTRSSVHSSATSGSGGRGRVPTPLGQTAGMGVGVGGLPNLQSASGGKRTTIGPAMTAR